MNVQEQPQHVPFVMKLPTDINPVTNVFVKTDFMMTELTIFVKNVVISVSNVKEVPITVPSVKNQELMNQIAIAQMELLMTEPEYVLNVHTSVLPVKEVPVTVVHALETELVMIVTAQTIITMMVSMLTVHNVQIDVQNVIVAKSVPLVKPTEISSEDLVYVKLDIMKSVVHKELLVILIAHNQNVSNVTILVKHV